MVPALGDLDLDVCGGDDSSMSRSACLSVGSPAPICSVSRIGSARRPWYDDGNKRGGGCLALADGDWVARRCKPVNRTRRTQPWTSSRIGLL